MIQGDILDFIRRRGRGKVYTTKDLLHLGSRAAIDQTLSRLVRAGELQRLARGLYYYPKSDPRPGINAFTLLSRFSALGRLPPTAFIIASLTAAAAWPLLPPQGKAVPGCA